MQPIIKLEPGLRQRLFLLPAIRQALKILALPLLDLKTLIEEELNNNPLLERTERPESFLPLRKKTKTALLETLPYQPGLREHLTRQLHELGLKKNLRKIGEYLIGSLNEKGFLDEETSSLACELQTSAENICQVLKIIQTFDPPGIGAASLQESLLIQMSQLGQKEELGYLIIKNHFALFLKNRKKELACQLGVSFLKIEEALKKIKRLSLHPSAAFRSRETPWALIQSDLTIEYEQGRFFISVNETELPQVKINRLYLYCLASGQIEKAEKSTLKKAFFQARQMIKNLKGRHQLLKQIGALIVKKQAGYLLNQTPLQPFSLKELASELGLCNSSVSRLLNGKYLLSPRGLEPLKSFFSLPVAANSPISKNSALAILKKLILEEDKTHPLSDEKLKAKLNALGINWKRRTVAKYRRKLKLSSAYLRKP
ncbi:MAG: RNA polymerase factor sigma-54 [Parachlamydiales bacterium]|jgi:RNA polymerase sigma-54 factor